MDESEYGKKKRDILKNQHHGKAARWRMQKTGGTCVISRAMRRLWLCCSIRLVIVNTIDTVLPRSSLFSDDFELSEPQPV